MGEEEKKPEEAAGKKEPPPPPPKATEGEKGKTGEGKGKKDGGGGNGGEGEKKDGEKVTENPPPPPPPPEEVVMKVYMHCEGCAKKVRRSLWGFQGVEDVVTDSQTHRVVVKGRKAAEDPMKVVERVQRKSGRKVELLSPLPPPKSEKEEQKKEEKPKAEEKKEQQVILVVLKVYMHCGACAEEIKKWILRMKGVHTAEPDLKSSEVTVKGVFDPESLVSYVHKRTGKHASVVKQEPAEKKPEEPEKAKDVKNPGGGEKSGKDEKKGAGEKEEKEKKTKGGGGGGDAKKDGAASAEAEEKEEGEKNVDGGGAAKTTRRNEFYYYYPTTHNVEYAQAPQIFSDENPNACAVM
ncbi:heavy metal-associated isoprenylated plant protein 3-like [Canna indica]|uniref:Heavy metal-associated isoprenylated plant protein 3-like n=1 Tax=Canna indica TaxID=4628 RepID=A0AAQ3QCE2_9LILI|nr:heavy metal-associated isoprenylated plant protein 3-like [Canna indica]